MSFDLLFNRSGIGKCVIFQQSIFLRSQNLLAKLVTSGINIDLKAFSSFQRNTGDRIDVNVALVFGHVRLHAFDVLEQLRRPVQEMRR